MVPIKRKIFLLIFFIFLIFFLIFIFFNFANKKKAEKFSRAQVKNVFINLEIADSELEQYRGLSYRKELEPSAGMLFLFPDKQKRSFVMRDMNFNLDIVFIDENRIVDIYKNLPFSEDEQKILYTSSVPVDKVLELPGNFCEENNIFVSDLINFF